MKKYFVFLAIFGILFGFSCFASEEKSIPSLPPSPCYSGCGPKMETMLVEFDQAQAPLGFPGVYSGTCHHSAPTFDPEVDHASVILLDFREDGLRYFASIVGYFTQNEWWDWDLEKARAEMLPSWKKTGLLTFYPTAATAFAADHEGNPVYGYWLRQDPQTRVLYFIQYASWHYRTFCRLLPHLTQTSAPQSSRF